LQGFYAAGELSKFELISTVSGGGYPVYGLLDQMLRKRKALADLLDENGAYIRAVEEQTGFIGTGDMYSAAILGPLLWAPLSWFPRQYGAGRPMYAAEIHRSFTGHLMPMWGLPKLKSAAEIRNEGFPVPIFGTSASIGQGPPLNGYIYDFGHFFELSPMGSGAPNVGYFQTLAEQIEVADAVAMSAAAIDTPQGKLQLPAIAKAWNLGLGGAFSAPSEDAGHIYFYLADGGFIENLGLLPLLRRGCTDIVAFDNSDDDSLPFDAWFNFARRLSREEPGWQVSSELHAAGGVALPTDISDRWRLPYHVWDAGLVKDGRMVHVRIVKLGIDRGNLAAYPDDVRNFAKTNWSGATPGCSGSGLSRRCSFPLEATARQSFTKQEFQAYRHLGRWLAELSVKTPHVASTN
jgi:hypothetical protein